MDLIYQEVWDADQGANGLPALRPQETKDEARGYVVVDERSAEVGSDHQVIAEVVIPPGKATTYELCQKLLDNYALARAAEEFVRPEEIQEELDFIDAILDTPPIEVARRVLEDRLNLSVSRDLLAAFIKETWFKMGPAGNQPDASGFEHVFVGEQGGQATKIGGYHYWHKYFWDDGGGGGTDRLQYRGTKYGGADEPGKGILVPEVVTLSIIWDAPAGDGPGSGATLTKPIGGFFVGCSPECMVALGLIRCRTPSAKLTKINGAVYQLDLHRLDNEPNSIRTFFPRFVKADVIGVGEGEDPVAQGDGDDTFRIVAAMVNPRNPEGGREFLQIINRSAETASLSHWKVVAPNGTEFELADNPVVPGEVFTLQIPGSNGVLRNRSGEIRLLDPDGKLAQSCAYSTAEARREGAPILF